MKSGYCWLHWLVGLVLGAVLVSSSIAPAVAQDSDTELRSSADYVYGQSLEFRLMARNLGPVDGVTLFFRPHASVDSFAVEIPVSEGTQIDASYTVDLTQTRLAPFSTVSYWWELQRPDGDTLRVPEREISYVDDQFSWQWSTRTDPDSGGSISTYWTGTSTGLGDQALDMVSRMLPQIGSLLPLDEIRPFNVFIYPSSADLASAMRLAGLDWQPGESYPQLGVALLTVVNESTAQQELAEGLSRELTQLLLYQAAGDGVVNIPSWIRAGLEVGALPLAEGELEATLRAAAADGRLITFQSLCADFPTEGLSAAIAQVQSESILRFVATEYGPERVAALIAAFANGAKCDSAFRDVLQLGPDELEQRWLRRGTAAAADNGTAQSVAVILVLLAGVGLTALLIWRPRRNGRRT